MFPLRWLFFCLVLTAAFCLAQNPEGALVGSVRDSTGARIAGARISVVSAVSPLRREAQTNGNGEWRIEGLPPGRYRVAISSSGFAGQESTVEVAVGAAPSLVVLLKPAPVRQAVEVQASTPALSEQPVETTSSVEKTTIYAKDLADLPLAHRSFANIAYLAPMTEPVEPSDPTKARITAVSFAGSSGLNVDLSVDGGDNNDDYIGGFLQNFSPDAMQEFSVRTAQFDADTSRTNGGSVIITTRRGTDQWHGGGAFYYRGQALNARNDLDNPEPNPKQPFSRNNAVLTLGGPILRDKLWFFSSLEYVDENASVGYSAGSLSEFRALSQLASEGLVPGVSSIAVPTSVGVPFRDTLFSTRLDWTQSERSQWFLRGAFDLNHTNNDLVQQATLPSTGALSRSRYYSLLLANQTAFTPQWFGSFTFQASGFHHTEDRNSNLGFALAFPFSANFHTTSGFETFGDNQFITEIAAFPIRRDQEKYQFRYDVTRTASAHAFKFGVNLVHEPVLSGVIADSPETLVQFPHDPSFYLASPEEFADDYAAGSTFFPGGNGAFSQNMQRLGMYAQDSWRVTPNLTLNYGLRYDTTFGLFIAQGQQLNQNAAIAVLDAAGFPLQPGAPHDYRHAFAPRLGIAYSPGQAGKTVLRAGVGLYYNDLAQNGWVDAFRGAGGVIDPNYRTPYAIQASAGIERELSRDWRLNIHYEHQQGVHQYRRYEFVAGYVLPPDAPDLSVFRTDNRSRYDGVSFLVQHRLAQRFDLTAHYTLASASTWGATVGELFDYVNGVSNVFNPFGPGDYGPSGEDVRHRLVIAATVDLPAKFQVSTLSQFESARPFTLATPVDLNNDGTANDRAVVNGVQTTLDEFRGTPFVQVDMRVMRNFLVGDRVSIRPFVEFFNLFNRMNPGNNFVGDISALPVPPDQLSNVTSICLNAACTTTRPLNGLGDLRVPAGALGDFFGPGTTVGIPFAAQVGVRISF